MASSTERPQLGPLILGGAGFSFQLESTPKESTAVDVLERAFELGVRTIDTSPYYEPSEQLLGAALAHSRITSKFRREEYQLMTKCGRISADEFNYSPEWVRQSVQRSLTRFRTSYLDVVFCHDIEFLPVADVVQAVATLFELAEQGMIKFVGISGYDIEALEAVAAAVLKQCGRPVDVVQNWGQMTLQNTRLDTHLQTFRESGVKAMCASSPLAIGLLRDQPVPQGTLGDWHPAPNGLREQANLAARHVAKNGNNLASLALQYALQKGLETSSAEMPVSIITGAGSVDELEENVSAARQVLNGASANTLRGSQTRVSTSMPFDRRLCEEVREILGPWVDYDFTKKTSTPRIAKL